MATADFTRAPRGTTTRDQQGESTAPNVAPTAFNIERDLIHPASDIVGNLRDALAAIGDPADTKAAAAEVDRLRDLLDDVDIAAIQARKGAAPAPAFDPALLESACRSLFGAHPEEVISPLNCASDTLGWLEEILRTIAKEADKCRSYRIKRLAEAGAYIASDIGNFADCEHEKYRDALIAAGVVDANVEEGGAA